MLDLARQRLEVKQQAQDSPSGQRRPTLGSELRAALRQLQGLPPAEGPEQGEGQAGGAGAKRPAAEGAADASLEDEVGMKAGMGSGVSSWACEFAASL